MQPGTSRAEAGSWLPLANLYAHAVGEVAVAGATYRRSAVGLQGPDEICGQASELRIRVVAALPWR
jgi:hypothetical protein